jgi:hypothetical protein
MSIEHKEVDGTAHGFKTVHIAVDTKTGKQVGSTICSISQMIEENGRTVRENNMERIHNIPVGTLVEVKFDNWHGDGACAKIHARMFVASCGRDCDGTPLYWLTHRKPPFYKFRDLMSGDADAHPQPITVNEFTFMENMYYGREGGFTESSLTVIDSNPLLSEGYGSLSWGEHYYGDNGPNEESRFMEVAALIGLPVRKPQFRDTPYEFDGKVICEKFHTIIEVGEDTIFIFGSGGKYVGCESIEFATFTPRGK